MKTDLQKLQNVRCDDNVAVDLITSPEAHGIELHVEELELLIAPSKFKLL